jgi:signal transduction histidine kinase
MKKLFAIFVLLISQLVALAQQKDLQRKIDSLLFVSQSVNDTTRLDIYCSLSNLFRQTDLEQSLMYARKAIEGSEKYKHHKAALCGYNNLGITYYYKGLYDSSIAAFDQYKNYSILAGDSLSMAYAYNNIGNVYIDKGMKDYTLLYYDSALQIRLRNYDTASIANSYINLGYINKDLGNYTRALLHLYKAVNITENNPAHEHLTAYAYNFIAATYSHIKNYNRAIWFAQKARFIYEKRQDLNNVAIMNNMIGINQLEQGDTTAALLNLNKAYTYYKQVNDIRQLAVISNTLSKVELGQQRYDKALQFGLQALSFHHAIGNKRLLGSTYAVVAQAYLSLSKTAAALSYADSAFAASQQTGENEVVMRSLLLLKDIHTRIKNYEKALQFSEMYRVMNDSMQRVNNARTIEEISTVYETEKKDLQIANQSLEITSQQAKLQKRNIQLIAGIALFVLASVIGLLLHNRFKLRQKSLFDAERLAEQKARNKAIIEAEEKERVRIARELHDGVGQQVAAAKINLSGILPDVTNDVVAERLKAVMQLIDESAAELRTVSHNMIPNALLRSGLVSAVREFIGKIAGSGIIKIHLDIVGLEKRLNSTTETVLYRVLQECVSNTIKHASATELNIQLVQHPNYLSMMIEDNGKGFDPANLSPDAGIGLKNIQSRVEYLNGSVEFDSMPGRGTTVLVNVPI